MEQRWKKRVVRRRLQEWKYKFRIKPSPKGAHRAGLRLAESKPTDRSLSIRRLKPFLTCEATYPIWKSVLCGSEWGYRDWLNTVGGRYVGDYVVIADAKVAKTYATLLEKMGVTYLQGSVYYFLLVRVLSSSRFRPKTLTYISSCPSILTVRSNLGMCKLADLDLISNLVTLRIKLIVKLAKMINLRGLANALALIAFPRAGQDSAKY